MNPETMAFWLAGIFPPVTGSILNLAIRGPGAFKTSCADWALIFFVFDAAIAISLQDIVCNIPNEAVRTFIPSIAPTLMLSSMGIWIAIVRWLEPLNRNRRGTSGPLFSRLVGRAVMWSLILLNTFFHYFLFIRGFHVD